MLFQYSPADVNLNVFGIPINAYADGTFVTIKFNEDQFTEQVGSLGDVTRTKNLNLTAEIEITLKAHAPVNDLIMAKAAIDYTSGDGVGPISMDETVSGTRAHGAYAWVKKFPDIDRAKESGSVKWMFACSSLELVIGGSLIFRP